MTEIEEMAKVIIKQIQYDDKQLEINSEYAIDLSLKIATALDKAGYRHEAEVRAETARDILGQIQSILGGMIKQDYEDSVQYYQGNCEDIDDRLQNIAEQFGKEEK